MSTFVPVPTLEMDLRFTRRRLRRFKSAVASVAMAASFAVVMVPLLFVVGYVVSRGFSILSWTFLTQSIPFSARDTGPGMGPAVVGTLLITGMATLIAVPLGVLGGIYLNEYGGTSRVAGVLRFLADVMTGVPSIIMGLFIYTFVVVRTQERNGLAGSLALACLMLPVIIRTTEEMLKLVEAEQREASGALGARQASTILRVVLPAAVPGILSGVLLAVARAAGETAPLLFTIGIVNATNTNLFTGPNTSLSAQIFANAQSPFTGGQERAWGAALTLILIVFTCTILARLVSALFTRNRG